MYYRTTRRTPCTQPITFEQILFNFENDYLGKHDRRYRKNNQTITRVYESKIDLSVRNVTRLLNKFASFNWKYRDLFDAPRESLYHSYHIPKNSGGWRQIDEPLPELKAALNDLRIIFEKLGPLHHASAYAYVKKRSPLDLVKLHQRAGSTVFMRTDLHDFFGSSTEEFVRQQIGKIYPFCNILEADIGGELYKALSLCFLRGTLPQGSPISPLLSNLIMIPIDYELLKRCSAKKIIYTRYADDMVFSANERFPSNQVLIMINDVLRGTPYRINKKKTQYRTNSGKNWLLGVMLNKDNQITIGRQAKKQFKAAVWNHLMDANDGKPLNQAEKARLKGVIAYYRNVDKDFVDRVFENYRLKLGVNFDGLMRNEAC